VVTRERDRRTRRRRRTQAARLAPGYLAGTPVAGTSAREFRHAVAVARPDISASGIQREVTIEEPEHPLHAATDEAYRSNRFNGCHFGGLVGRDYKEAVRVAVSDRATAVDEPTRRADYQCSLLAGSKAWLP
jgi:hypothetical protein